MTTQYRPRVLVVEDNADARLLLRLLLQTDYDVEVCCSVRDGVDAATGGPFDLIILDINLGEELTGIDVLERIRKTPVHEKTPAIAMTAYAMPGDRERFLELGFAAYLAKPFTRGMLMACVERVIAQVQLKNS